MKQLLTLLAFYFLAASPLSAQITKETQFVIDLIDEWDNRFNGDLPEDIEQILTEDATLAAGNFIARSREEIIEKFVKVQMPSAFDLKSSLVRYEITKDMIFAFAEYEISVRLPDGNSVTGPGNVTYIWKRTKGKDYKLCFLHIEDLSGKQ